MAEPDAPGVIRHAREQTLSHEDLHRLLPRLLAPDFDALPWRGAQLSLDYPDGRKLGIELEPERVRRLGSLRTLSTTINFCFTGWSQQQVDMFLKRCGQCWQQGGG